MSLMNDYTYEALTDDREREMARLAEHHQHVRAALNGRVSWWRKIATRRGQRISIATKRPAHGSA